MPVFPTWIHQIHRVVQHIPVQVRIAPGEAYRVFGGPSAREGVVLSEAEVDQSRLSVAQAAGKTEGNGEAFVGVFDYITETVVNDLFDDGMVYVGDDA